MIPKEIKSSVENTLNISFTNKSRERKMLDGRVVFCLICLGNPINGKRTKNQTIAYLLNKKHDIIVYYKKIGRTLIQHDKEFKKKYIDCLKSIGKSEEEISIQTSVEFIEKITVKLK